MSHPSSRWLLIAISSLSLGSIVAISEKLITSKIDSSLPESSKVLEFSRPGTLTFVSSKGKIIQKIGPATREKIIAEEIPLHVKESFLASISARLFYVWYTRIRPRKPSTNSDWNTDCEFQSSAIIEEHHITFSKVRNLFQE